MPIKYLEEEQILLNRETGYDQIEEADAEPFIDRLRAAFTLENSIGSALAEVSGLPDKYKNTDYDVWGDLDEDEKLDKSFIENIRYADSFKELEAVRLQRSNEMAKRKTLEGGAFLPSLAVGIADPINFIPVGGTAYKTYKTGGSILKNAALVAGTSGVSATLAETALHQTQLTRTFGESAANVTAATLLGGVLGAAPGTITKMFNKGQFDDVSRTLDPEAILAAGGNPALSPRDASAAQALSDTDINVRGKAAKWFIKHIGFDPLSRNITHDLSSVRKNTAELAEIPIEMDRSMGTSVESLVKSHDGKFYEAIKAHTDIFDDYKRAGGKLKPKEFNEQVSAAIRHGSDDEFLQKAADAWNTKLYEPLKKAAIEEGLLPADVDVATAIGYLNRTWSKEKIMANSPKFIQTVKRWLDDENIIKMEGQEEIGRVQDVVDETMQTQVKLSSQMATVEKQLAFASRQLAEVQRAEKAGIERAFVTKEQAAGNVKELQEKLVKLEAEKESLTKRDDIGKANKKIKELRKKIREEKKTLSGKLPGKKGQRRELGTAETRQRNRSNELQDRISGSEIVVLSLEANKIKNWNKL